MSEETTEAAEPQVATFDDLITGAGPVEVKTVTLSSGRVVRVRGMTRYEIHLGGKDTDDAAVIEARNLS